MVTDGSAVLALWDALKPKLRQMIRDETRSAVRKKKMDIVSISAGNQTMTVREAANPDVTLTLHYRKESGAESLIAGQSVQVEWIYDDLSTAVISGPGQGWSADAAQNFDSGWQDFPFSSAFENYDSENNTLRYHRIGNVVELIGEAKPTAAIAASGSETIGTLPEGYRPGQNVSIECQGSQKTTWLLTITAGGVCTFSRYGAAAFASASTAAWLPMHAVFLTTEDIPGGGGIVVNGETDINLSGLDYAVSGGAVTISGATIGGSGGNITIGGS